jgi:Protein of unknown function (DUF3750)
MKSKSLLAATALTLLSHTASGSEPIPEPQARLAVRDERAVVQVYAARVMRWRGNFAVHTWVALKPEGSKNFTTFNVIGWRQLWGRDIVVVDETTEPGAPWYGNEAELLYELRGEKAKLAIPKIEAAVKSYPYPSTYRAWPGPNSNTFVSYIVRQTPEMGVSLPSTAIGKDWIENGKLAGLSESKTGVQVSLFGLLGLTLGAREGIEVNLLGLSFGLDVLRPALKLPMVGRVGMSRSPFVDSE